MSTSTSTTAHANAHAVAGVVLFLEEEIAREDADWSMGGAVVENYTYPHKEIIAALERVKAKIAALGGPSVAAQTVTVSVEPYAFGGRGLDSGAGRIGGWKATCAELPDWYAVPGDCTEEEARVYGVNLALKELAHRAWMRLCKLREARGAERP